MEKAKEVRFRKTASDSIAAISYYIEEKGYPITAERFADGLYDFGLSLKLFTNKYALCRNTTLALLNMRCAVFGKSFVFIYKVNDGVLEIYNIVHASTLK